MTTTATSELALSTDAQNLLFRSARTANAFTDEQVSDEQVEAIYDLVRWGPTSMNAQPLRVVLLRSDDAKARLLPHLGEGNRAKTAAAPLVAVLAYDVDFHDHLPAVFPHFPGARDVFSDEELRHRVGRDNAYLQAGYFLLGIRAAGLAAGPMGGYDAAGLDAELFPDGRTKSVMVVNIGRPGPGAWFERLPRLDYDQVVTAL
ncbi:MAG: malonic semialdehyde reductase [Actinomycetota bacterium]|nr:malonic semialdehyde reductase [Actinomycetota bacterium]